MLSACLDDDNGGVLHEFTKKVIAIFQCSFTSLSDPLEQKSLLPTFKKNYNSTVSLFRFTASNSYIPFSFSLCHTHTHTHTHTHIHTHTHMQIR